MSRECRFSGVSPTKSSARSLGLFAIRVLGRGLASKSEVAEGVKLLYFCPVGRGGLADYARQQANAISELGVTVDLLTVPGFNEGQHARFNRLPRLKEPGVTNEALSRVRRRITAARTILHNFKVLSKTIFLPRPEIQTQKIYRLEDDQLVEMKRMPVRTMLDDESQKDHRALLSGDIDSNDLGSFPSDHAGLFIAISLGIFLASRRLGLLALGWTIFVIIGGKLISGQHTPVDIAAGATVAIVELAVIQYFARKNFRNWLDKVTGLTLRYSALSSAIVFLIAFEVSSTMIHIRAFLGFLAVMRRHVLLGMGS